MILKEYAQLLELPLVDVYLSSQAFKVVSALLGMLESAVDLYYLKIVVIRDLLEAIFIS